MIISQSQRLTLFSKSVSQRCKMFDNVRQRSDFSLKFDTGIRQSLLFHLPLSRASINFSLRLEHSLAISFVSLRLKYFFHIDLLPILMRVCCCCC